MRLYRNLTIGALLALALPLQGASAITQCTVHVSKIFSGDNGHIWVFYVEGGAAYLTPTDPDREATLTLAMTALMASRSVTVRYTADNVDCLTSRWDLEGFFLN